MHNLKNVSLGNEDKDVSFSSLYLATALIPGKSLTKFSDTDSDANGVHLTFTSFVPNFYWAFLNLQPPRWRIQLVCIPLERIFIWLFKIKEIQHFLQHISEKVISFGIASCWYPPKTLLPNALQRLAAKLFHFQRISFPSQAAGSRLQWSLESCILEGRLPTFNGLWV